MKHLHHLCAAVCLLLAGMLLTACSDSDDQTVADDYKWETFEHQELLCFGPPTYNMFVMDRCAYRHLKTAFSGQWTVYDVLAEGQRQYPCPVSSVTYEPGKSVTVVSRDGTTTTCHVTSEQLRDGIYRITAGDTYSFYIREGEMKAYHDAENGTTMGYVNVGLRMRAKGQTISDILLHKDITADEVKWYEQNLCYKEITIWACLCNMMFDYR